MGLNLEITMLSALTLPFICCMRKSMSILGSPIAAQGPHLIHTISNVIFLVSLFEENWTPKSFQSQLNVTFPIRLRYIADNEYPIILVPLMDWENGQLVHQIHYSFGKRSCLGFILLDCFRSGLGSKCSTLSAT